METIDSFLNKITMYKLTLYYLIGLLGVAVILSFFHLLSYNPLDIIISTLIIVGVSVIANFLFAKIFNAVTNVESVFITALIIALIIPLTYPVNLIFFIEAGILSMGVKYFLTVNKRHLFNPAAAAIVIIALLTNYSATWWVGTPVMLPFVALGGFLLMRKTRKETLVFNFLLAYFLIVGAGAAISNGSIFSIINVWQHSVLNSALLFFTFVMLTEPMTSPTTEKLQGYYGYLVALLYATPQIRLISVALTPEMALCIGNIFSYIMSPNYRLDLSLKWKKQLSTDTFAFAFKRIPDLKFIPGQYMEWTLPHKNADSRGNRRYFSVASSPTEENIIMAVKFYTPSSSYKKKLLSLNTGEKIIAAQVAGDFTLPENLKKPLVFIAGGVGIAPFRSMIQYIIDKNLSADIILLYTNRTKEDILFSDIFERAKPQGVKTIYNLTDLKSVPEDWQGTTGYITKELIQKEIPNYQNRVYYLSGPQLMVQNFERTLLDAGVKQNKIKTDFFPGYSEK